MNTQFETLQDDFNHLQEIILLNPSNKNLSKMYIFLCDAISLFTKDKDVIHDKATDIILLYIKRNPKKIDNIKSYIKIAIKNRLNDDLHGKKTIDFYTVNKDIKSFENVSSTISTEDAVLKKLEVKKIKQIINDSIEKNISNYIGDKQEGRNIIQFFLDRNKNYKSGLYLYRKREKELVINVFEEIRKKVNEQN